MIITGGSCKGRKIKTPKDNVRPTSSKVRESIFNILQNRILNAVMLDLFAGSGIMGIEALSRGAGKVVFVEKNSQTARILRENLSSFVFDNNVFVMDALIALDRLKGLSFDIIFLDPPYNSELIPHSLEKIKNNSLLNEDGVIVIEYSSKRNIDEIVKNAGFNPFKSKTYGDTTISICEHFS